MRLQDARERVDRRLVAVAGNEGSIRVDRAVLALAGTGVDADELQDELALCRQEYVREVVRRGAHVGGWLNGLAFRTFLLGYESGRLAADEEQEAPA